MEPILYISSVMKVIGGLFTDDQVRDTDSQLAEGLYNQPSVFSYYSPLHQLPDGTYAPEAQLLDNAHGMTKIAILYNLLHTNVGGLWVDLSRCPFWNSASNDDLLDLMNHLSLSRRDVSRHAQRTSRLYQRELVSIAKQFAARLTLYGFAVEQLSSHTVNSHIRNPIERKRLEMDRRQFLGRAGRLFTGAAMMPLLPRLMCSTALAQRSGSSYKANRVSLPRRRQRRK